MTSSTRSSTRFASWVATAAFAVVTSVALRGDHADACGYGDFFGIVDTTTFDPKVLGEAVDEGLYYNPDTAAFTASCEDCKPVVLDDWKTYFKDGLKPADWEHVLYKAGDNELALIAQRLAGKIKGGPKGYDASSIWSPAIKDRLVPAVAYVQLARAIEQHASFDAFDAAGNPRTVATPPEHLVVAARAGMKAAKEPFFAQRYAFQALRVTFYRRDWPAVIAFFDKNTQVLAGPSVDLAWRARQYAAGALARNGQRGRANLELARIHAAYPPLSGLAVQEFKPAEERDWRESLRLARSVREKTELWRMVGIKLDGVVAMQEILKLDPKSSMIGLLLVRELARAESRATEHYGRPDPKDLAAQKKAYLALEQIAVGQLARGRDIDRPWLMELVAGHLAAKRGDVATARARLARAAAARPADVRVTSQARASLAIALVAGWKITPQHEDELAVALAGLDPSYGRAASVRDDVRRHLAKQYAQAGRFVEAEFLRPGTVDARDPATGKLVTPGKPRWADAAFIREMIARTTKTATAFERFVLAGSLPRAGLEQDLALRLLLDGDVAGAAKAFKDGKPKSELLGTDPFVIHIVDCHDCDHAKYKAAKWTHASFVARLAELEQKAKQGGEVGAEAALALGNGYYNVTWYGNARVVLGDSHQATADTAAALRWYKRAYELSKNRELKAKAAFLAAKAELGGLITASDGAIQYMGALPVPTTWFPILKGYASTRYYKEVLVECGHFQRWVN